jgi:hypothetical protein
MKIPIASLFCLLGLAVVASAQETIYSANSLMAAFEKDSKLKGADITFRDIVVDNKNSRVTFRSADNSRVICVLNPASANPNKQPPIANMVTITGRVRGRGLLGNVTLDNCALATHAETVAVPAEPPAPQEVAVAPPEAVSETTSPLNDSPVQELQESAKPDVAPVKTKRANPVAMVKKEAAPAPRLAQIENPPEGKSVPKAGVPYGFYVLLIISGAVGFSILSKLVGAMRSVQFSRSPTIRNTPEIRQAALQALLLKESKKR